MKQQVLAINAGSSSIKFAIFELCSDVSDRIVQILEGAVDEIGENATFWIKNANHSENFNKTIQAADNKAAVAILLSWIEEHFRETALTAIGHRFVHGGPEYFEAQKMSPKMLADLRKLSFFDPKHLPSELLLCDALQKKFPHVPQIACFDTAFHRDMPRVAQMLPLPRRYQAQGVHRYGFHGLSYSYLMHELSASHQSASSANKIVLAHLGSGASLAAVSANKPIDTSMGFTPNSGVPMGTRSGNLDPGLVSYFAHTEGLNTKGFDEMVNFQSGLLGISETSSNMRVLLEQETTDIRSAEAIELFCYEVKKCIGAFAAALGGLDVLVFSGGIGEHSSVVRSRICEGLKFLGIELNEEINMTNAAIISVNEAKVCVRVLHADEARMIAMNVCRILSLQPNEETA